MAQYFQGPKTAWAMPKIGPKIDRGVVSGSGGGLRKIITGDGGAAAAAAAAAAAEERRREAAQNQNTSYEGGGGSSTGGGIQDWMAQIQGMMPQQQSFQMPTAPQEPVVTQSMIVEWQKRAMEEAGLTYDPQILSIQQQLDKAVLSAQQTKGGIAPSYEEVLSNITKWQEDTIKAEQGRAYARGFGQGGGLMQTETDVAKEALKQQTGALTEKARAETNIDAQIQQLKEQAGQQITGAESAKAQYVSTRRADLEDSYKQNRAQLDQNKFANEMAISNFGLTKESQDFSNWLNSMSLATDMWYKDQSLSLDKMAQELGVQANAEALNWDKEKFNTTNAINAANRRGSGGGTATANNYEITLDNGQKRNVSFNDWLAWQKLLQGNKSNNTDTTANTWQDNYNTAMDLYSATQDVAYLNKAKEIAATNALGGTTSSSITNWYKNYQ